MNLFFYFVILFFLSLFCEHILWIMEMLLYEFYIIIIFNGIQINSIVERNLEYTTNKFCWYQLLYVGHSYTI